MNRTIISFASTLFVSLFFGADMQNCSVRAFVLTHPTVRNSNQRSLSAYDTRGSIVPTVTALQASSNPYERYSQMQDVVWDAISQLLEDYQSRYGNCDVPFNYYVRLVNGSSRKRNTQSRASYNNTYEEDEDLINLGKWLRRQREAKRSNKLPHYKYIRLTELGVSWDTNAGLSDAYTITVSRHLKDVSMDYIRWKRSFSFHGKTADRSVTTWMTNGSGNLEFRRLKLKPTSESLSGQVGSKNADAIDKRSRWDVTREGWISHAEYTPFPWYS